MKFYKDYKQWAEEFKEQHILSAKQLYNEIENLNCGIKPAHDSDINCEGYRFDVCKVLEDIKNRGTINKYDEENTGSEELDLFDY